jgi:hypothetical protein
MFVAKFEDQPRNRSVGFGSQLYVAVRSLEYLDSAVRKYASFALPSNL